MSCKHADLISFFPSAVVQSDLLQLLNFAWTFPWDITKCILRIQEKHFAINRCMTLNHSGTLQTESSTVWLIFTTVVVSIVTVQCFLSSHREWSVAEHYLLCAFWFLQEQFWNMWRSLNGESGDTIIILFCRGNIFRRHLSKNLLLKYYSSTKT